jgi:hypothetical protein
MTADLLKSLEDELAVVCEYTTFASGEDLVISVTPVGRQTVRPAGVERAVVRIDDKEFEVDALLTIKALSDLPDGPTEDEVLACLEECAEW